MGLFWAYVEEDEQWYWCLFKRFREDQGLVKVRWEDKSTSWLPSRVDHFAPAEDERCTGDQLIISL